jgi:hypothetical protein
MPNRKSNAKKPKRATSDDDSSVDSHGNVRNLIEYEEDDDYSPSEESNETSIAKRVRRLHKGVKKSGFKPPPAKRKKMVKEESEEESEEEEEEEPKAKKLKAKSKSKKEEKEDKEDKEKEEKEEKKKSKKKEEEEEEEEEQEGTAVVGGARRGNKNVNRFTTGSRKLTWMKNGSFGKNKNKFLFSDIDEEEEEEDDDSYEKSLSSLGLSTSDLSMFKPY